MRNEQVVGDKAIAYGNDHAVGLFIQVWKINPKLSLSHNDNKPDDSNIIVDKDEMFDKLTIEEFKNIATDNGFMFDDK